MAANAALGSKEHYELMEFFERLHSHLRLDRESEEFQRKGHVYQNGEANSLFIAFRHGYEFGKAQVNE